jgi:transcriptional regulator with XRE-family HTH domain
MGDAETLEPGRPGVQAFNRTESLKMSPSQVRMACAGLGWSWSDLAEAADVSRDTIARFLRGEELKVATVTAIYTALEAAGVEFITENGGGVRLLRTTNPKAKGKGKR